MKLNINDRAALAIRNNTKRVEIRANTGKNDYSKFNVGDLIVFKNTNEEEITCKILEINHYETIEELLMLEGTRYTTSSTNNYEEGIKSINSINGYKEAIEKSGVYAIHIDFMYKNDEIWEYLYEAAKKVLNPREISNVLDGGGVAAAFLSKEGNIYTGVCIDTACSIGMCAERNALSNMITQGESEVEKLVCIGGRGLMLPCGVCREFMMQLSKNNKDLEILTNLDKKEIITLKKILPNWWN